MQRSLFVLNNQLRFQVLVQGLGGNAGLTSGRAGQAQIHGGGIAAIKSGKAPVDAYIKLGELLREDGSPTKALQIHKSLTVKTDLGKKEKMELFINIARDYSKLGNSEQAVKVLNTATKISGVKDQRLLPMLAREYHVLGKTDESYKCLREMKREGAVGDRELSLYLCTAGEQKEDDDKLKDALKLYKNALKQDPKNPVAAPNLLG